jgi:predicted phage replisome organizer/uncharacterized phage protein (TIGR02220 family)
MADIKWIKITTDIFDDEKMLLIESMPEADSLIVIWFKLLAFAGKSNNNGVFMLSDKIPYTDEMLSTIFRRPLNTVRLALQTFEQFGMIEYIGGVIAIPNWERHQNIEGMEKLKAQNRERVARHRERQKLLVSNENCNANCNVTVTECNATEEDKEKEEEKEKEKDKEKEKGSNINYQKIVDMYHHTCLSYPKVRALSDARKKTIKARCNNGYTLKDFQEVFEKAERSSFLKGENNRKWSATFDWLIKDSNFAKVLDGNYDDKTPKGNASDNPYAQLKGVTTL